MEIAKALILAGPGRDDRPWPIAPAGPKQLFPVANRPLLFHGLEALRAAGILEATILAGASNTQAIRAAVGEGRRWALTIRYADWDSVDGLSGALTAGHDFFHDEPILVQEAGALLRDRLHGHISSFAREQLDALALRLPDVAGGSPHATTPGYLLSAKAVAMLLDRAQPAASPVATVRARGGRVRIQPVDGCLPCHGGQESLLEGNRHMLEQLATSFRPSSLDQCEVQGPVDVHPSAHVSRTVLRGPLIIGPGARVSEAYIGPYTSIGAGVVIEGTEIEHSIVLPDAELRFVGTRLESSVIGRGARVLRGFHIPAGLRMSIGDGAEVHLR